LAKAIDWRALPVHPVAALFPMMTEDELTDLAVDIKTNGLVHPIVRGDWIEDGEPQYGIVDGRNRRAACTLAGVEPTFTEFTGADATSFIISSNISRRHLTVGQIAMTIALARRVENPAEPPSLGGRGKRGGYSELARLAGVDRKRISEATLVMEYAAEMVDEVMTNNRRLDAAYKAAVERQRAKEWRTEGMEKLRKAAPEMGERVDKGELTFEEARTLLIDRDKTEAQVRQTAFQMLADFVRLTDGITKTPRLQELPEWLKNDEYEQDFRHYFKGGAAELKAGVEIYQRAVDDLKKMIRQLPKRRGTAK
jgi:ParB-like chromosome segregation protein Spo0J